MEEKNSVPNVHAGHRQRMKEMFLKNGFEGFSEHQILEMVLFYSCPRIDTNEIAHNLIDRFGGLCGVLTLRWTILSLSEGFRSTLPCL